MELVGKPVPDRNTGICSQFLHNFLLKAAILNAIIHAAKNSGSIPYGFLFPDLGGLRIKISTVHAKICRSNLKCAARSGTGLFKDQSNILVLAVMMLLSGLFHRFQLCCKIEKVFDFSRCIFK